MWSLTLPQVAVTLAAALVGYNTFDPARHRLIDDRVLNAVFVLILTTSRGRACNPLLPPHPPPRMAHRYQPHFEAGSALLSPADKTGLMHFANGATGLSACNIRVQGFADFHGNNAYDQH